MRIAYLTAGAAGMYCGSCMHDNALARALIDRGCDCLLLPVYTPIRTDEPSVSADRVFFGGINVYLQQKLPVLGRLPGPLLRMLDAPWLLRAATRRAGGTEAATLGDLTVSMLMGEHGHQAGEVRRLVRWLADHFQPDAIILSNLLIGGCIPALREAVDVPVVVWLQGDDIFLDHLPDGPRTRSIELMGRLAAEANACLVNSRFYAEKMGRMLRIPEDKFRILPLAIPALLFSSGPIAEIDPTGETGPPAGESSEPAPVRIGYLARLAPEKGFHLLVDAFIELSRRVGPGRAELHYAGWLGEHHRAYFDGARRKLAEAGLDPYHHHHGSPDLQGKIDFLRRLDLLSVPTVYEEPKGLFVLEALASGVPVVQPAHGAFPELVASTGGGRLFESGNVAALATALEELVLAPEERRRLGEAGRQGVLSRHSIDRQAAEVTTILTQFAERSS